MNREALLRKISSGVSQYLQPGEVINRAVAAQTVSQLWQVLPLVLMLGAFVVAHFILHADKFVVVAILAIVFVAYLALNSKVLYCYVIVTDQRVLVVDGGYFGANPGQRLLHELSIETRTGIPLKRWRRIDVLAERLYVRYSIAAPTLLSSNSAS